VRGGIVRASGDAYFDQVLGGGIGGDFVGLMGVSGGWWGESWDFGSCVFGQNPGPSSVEERAFRRSHVQRARGGT
jgi:hypothetical protein